MTDTAQLASVQEELMQIPSSRLPRQLPVPVVVCIQEARQLYLWCQADRERLVSAGLDWALAADLPRRAGALQAAHNQWEVCKRAGAAGRRRLGELLPRLRETHTALLHDLRFAFRGDPRRLSGLKMFSRRRGYASLIQNVHNMVVIARGQTGQLEGIGFDFSRLEAAEALAKEFSELYAEKQSDRRHSELKELRDRALAFLKQATGEVRRCGRYVFWREPERRQGYVSAFLRRRRQGRK